MHSNQLLQSRAGLLIGYGIWAICTAVGFVWLMTYKSEAGILASPPELLPANYAQEQIQTTTQNQLLVFLHPHCSCSFATLNELHRLLSNVKTRPNITIYFADIDNDTDIKDSGLWKLAQQTNHADTIIDKQNKASELFKVETSGNLILFNHEGQLAFNGGITSSRGHEGDSQGKLKLKAILDNETTQLATSNAYGCGLHSREDST